MPRSTIEKRDTARAAEVQVLLTSWGSASPAGRMLISSPLEIEGVVRGIRKGHALHMGDLRARLAARHGANYACPLTTGIFLRIVAEAGEEERAQGRQRIAPWWRVVRDDGRMNEKSPGGAAAHARELRAEGVSMARAGASWRVASLARPRAR